MFGLTFRVNGLRNPILRGFKFDWKLTRLQNVETEKMYLEKKEKEKKNKVNEKGGQKAKLNTSKFNQNKKRKNKF